MRDLRGAILAARAWGPRHDPKLLCEWSDRPAALEQLANFLRRLLTDPEDPKAKHDLADYLGRGSNAASFLPRSPYNSVRFQRIGFTDRAVWWNPVCIRRRLCANLASRSPRFSGRD